MDLSLETRQENGRTIIEVGGEIDVYTAPKLRECITNLVDEGQVDLVIDLEQVEFMDSTGLGVLVGIYHRLRARDGTMSFMGVNDRVRRVFHVTQLTKIFVLHRSLEDAIAAHEAASA